MSENDNRARHVGPNIAIGGDPYTDAMIEAERIEHEINRRVKRWIKAVAAVVVLFLILGPGCNYLEYGKFRLSKEQVLEQCERAQDVAGFGDPMICTKAYLATK